MDNGPNLKRAKRQSLTPTDLDAQQQFHQSGSTSATASGDAAMPTVKIIMKKQKLEDGSAVAITAQRQTPLQKVCKEVLGDLKKHTDQTGRLVASLFIELPSRKFYPDYYVVIKDPLSISCLSGKQYDRIADFKADLKRIFDNARTYNQEGSVVYEDANTLEKFAMELIDKKMAALIKPPPPPVPTVTVTAPQLIVKPPQQPEAVQPQQLKVKKQKPSVQLTIKDDLTVFFDLIERGDVKGVGEMLKKGTVGVNSLHESSIFQTPFSWTPLHCAAFYGRVKVLSALLQAGAKLEMVDTTYKGTALAWAAFNNQFKAANLLVRDFNANKDAKNADGLTPYDLLPEEADDNAMWLDILVDEKPLIVPQTFNEGDVNSTDVMTVIYNHLVNLRDVTGRRYSDIFMDLPSRKDYPTYYTLIKNPIAFKLIAKRLVLGYYEALEDFAADLALMFENAQTFNPVGSYVHEDSKYLQQQSEFAQLAAKRGVLKNYIRGEVRDLGSMADSQQGNYKFKSKPKVTIKLPTASSSESLLSQSSGIENKDANNLAMKQMMPPGNMEDDQQMTIMQQQQQQQPPQKSSSTGKQRRKSAPAHQFQQRFGPAGMVMMDPNGMSPMAFDEGDPRRHSHSAAEMQRQALEAQYVHAAPPQQQQQQQQQQPQQPMMNPQTFVKVDSAQEKKRLPMLERVLITGEKNVKHPFIVFKPSIGRHGVCLTVPKNADTIKLSLTVSDFIEDPQYGFSNAQLQFATFNHSALPMPIIHYNKDSMDYEVKLEKGTNVFECFVSGQISESFAVANWNPQLNKYVQIPNGQTVMKSREYRQSFSVILVKL